MDLTDLGAAGVFVIVVLREIFNFLKEKKQPAKTAKLKIDLSPIENKIDRFCENSDDNRALLKDILALCESTKRMVSDGERRHTGDDVSNLLVQNSIKNNEIMNLLIEELKRRDRDQ